MDTNSITNIILFIAIICIGIGVYRANKQSIPENIKYITKTPEPKEPQGVLYEEKAPATKAADSTKTPAVTGSDKKAVAINP